MQIHTRYPSDAYSQICNLPLCGTRFNSVSEVLFQLMNMTDGHWCHIRPSLIQVWHTAVGHKNSLVMHPQENLSKKPLVNDLDLLFASFETQQISCCVFISSESRNHLDTKNFYSSRRVAKNIIAFRVVKNQTRSPVLVSQQNHMQLCITYYLQHWNTDISCCFKPHLLTIWFT